MNKENIIGYLGNITINEEGEGKFRTMNTEINIGEIIGRGRSISKPFRWSFVGIIVTEMDDSTNDSEMSPELRPFIGGVIGRSPAVGERKHSF